MTLWNIIDSELRSIGHIFISIYVYSHTIYYITFCFSWLESKRDDDNAEGLWRVHNTLYDLTKFINMHPGGSDWLIFTKVKMKIKCCVNFLLFRQKLYSRLGH